MTLALIDGPDNAERIRDRVAELLAIESAAQVRAADAAGKLDPDEWRFDVYTERANPWDMLAADDYSDPTPVVNVSWDSATYASGTVMSRQVVTGTFNIDCYAVGVATDDPAGGHVAGDAAAARNAQRVARLVRNILMAAENTYLGMRGEVGGRRVDSATVYHPPSATEQVVAVRVVLRVEFNEYSPQTSGETLTPVHVTVHRSGDGRILVEADYSTP